MEGGARLWRQLAETLTVGLLPNERQRTSLCRAIATDLGIWDGDKTLATPCISKRPFIDSSIHSTYLQGYSRFYLSRTTYCCSVWLTELSHFHLGTSLLLTCRAPFQPKFKHQTPLCHACRSRPPGVACKDAPAVAKSVIDNAAAIHGRDAVAGRTARREPRRT